MDTPPAAEVAGFLTKLYGTTVRELEPLTGGFWSSAFGYEADGRHLVVRLSDGREGFEMDRAAMAFRGPELPIPAVIEIGSAFGLTYCISERHYGRFLESVREDEAARAGPTIVRLLDALRRVPAPPDVPVEWHSHDATRERSWRQWLIAMLVDDPAHHVSGWRSALAADRRLDALFRALEQRVGELAAAVPERRDMVHGDLLHANVLVDEDASRVTAVFSWKCSVRGDFLYDTAWCTFWSPLHPGIAAADVWSRITAPRSAYGQDDLVDAGTRHHCYELLIGANHLGWYAWTGDEDGLRAVAARSAEILERGPLEPVARAPDGPS